VFGWFWGFLVFVGACFVVVEKLGETKKTPNPLLEQEAILLHLVLASVFGIFQPYPLGWCWWLC
jgi:hypothetical protein